MRFKNSRATPINAGCCEIILVNEGDLNGDGTQEISLFQAPENGCSYRMQTYSFKNGSWKLTLAPFLIPTGCDLPADSALQARVYSESGSIYFVETDMSTEEMPLVKKKAVSL